MFNFAYRNPTKIIFGKGQIASISGEVPTEAKVLVTYGGGSAEKAGTLKQVRDALAGRTVFEFGGIEPNPTYETLMKAVDLARKEKVDYLLAVGGGSVIDGTKFIAAAVPFVGEPWDIVAKAAKVESALPLGVVLTLSATGSEANSFAVITRRETTDKLAFSSELVFPKFSVLDPTVTFSLPPRQIGNGIVDAFVHVLEQYMTVPDCSPLSDRYAEGILQTLIEIGPKTFADPTDYDARANMMWCATQALTGWLRQGTPQDWSIHGIGHELTALYGLDHAQTLAVVLPPNYRLRKGTKRAKLLQYASRVWNIDAKDEDAAIEAAISKTAAFFESVGVPTKMAAYGKKCDVEAVIGQLQRHNRFPLGEVGDIDANLCRKILEAV
jgi:NADP-dependent alcohol dehydrogenase